jgi:hypothetical protein
VADWTGHSVDMLLRIYAKCIVGRDAIAKGRNLACRRLRADEGTVLRTASDSWIMSRPMWVSAVSDSITFRFAGLIESGLAAKDLAGFFSVFEVVKCLQFLNLLFCHVRMPPAPAKVADITEEH